MLALSSAAGAAPFTWTGAAGNGRWSDGGNWSGGRPPADDGSADVTLATGGTVTLEGVRVLSTLRASSGANVTLQAGLDPRSALILRGGGISRTARGKLSVQVPILAGAGIAASGFEAQATIANATVIDLTAGTWPGAT